MFYTSFFCAKFTRLEGNNNGDCISCPFIAIFSDSHKVHINIFTLDFNGFFLRSVILMQIFHWTTVLLFSAKAYHFSLDLRPLSNDDNSEICSMQYYGVNRDEVWACAKVMHNFWNCFVFLFILFFGTKYLWSKLKQLICILTHINCSITGCLASKSCIQRQKRRNFSNHRTQYGQPNIHWSPDGHRTCCLLNSVFTRNLKIKNKKFSHTNITLTN